MPTPILPCLEPFKKECSVEKCRLLCMIKNQTKRKKIFCVELRVNISHQELVY